MDDSSSDPVALRFIEQCRTYLRGEYRVKMRLAVDAIPRDVIWRRPNDASNSVGNLLLHLAGNLRQWVVAGIGGAADVRDRPSEFSTREGLDADELLDRLEAALDDVDAVLATLTPAQLLERRQIQGRELVVLDAILHVVEHFSYHLGQVILVSKAVAPGAVRFYDDTAGRAAPLWSRGQ